VIQGSIRSWDDEQGWGVLDSADTPGGCWAHFSVVRGAGLGAMQPGAPVLFDFEVGEQDGYSYRATDVTPA
jgi:CspA family cold shock protein